MSVQNQIKKQAITGALIRNFMINVKKTAEKARNRGFITARTKLLESYWQTYFQTHMDIGSEISEEEQKITPYFLDDVFTQMEIKYAEHLGELSDMLAALDTTCAIDRKAAAVAPPVQSSSTSLSVPLPRLQLPTFEGVYTQWPEFRDLFACLVNDNQSLTDVQRLQYLKSCCTGEAAAMLSNLPNTSVNFSIAWDTLTSRYQNKRMIVYSHFRNFLDLPASQEISRLLDGTVHFMRAVQAQQCPVEHWDDWIVYTILNKFEAQLRREWELSIQATSSLPKFTAMKTFLEGQLRALEFMTSAKPLSTKPITHNINSHLVFTPGECKLCHQEHALHNCPLFLKKNVQERREFISKHRLCLNCLKSGHKPTTCFSKRTCQSCFQRQHSTLHLIGENESKAVIPGTNIISSHLAASQLKNPVHQDILLSMLR